MQRKQVGEKISGLEVIGSIDNVGKVISERKVSEVIFSTDSITYTDILSVISRSKDWSVNFKLVPNSLEAIIGKTRIDELDTLPLVEIEYNIHKTVYRFLKRLFDVLLSLVLLVVVYPWARLRRVLSRDQRSSSGLLLLPRVLRGQISFVGRPLLDPDDASASGGPYGEHSGAAYLGPKGLTGLVQINAREGLENEEAEKYRLYYAKNQSLILDLEIIIKALILHLKKQKGSVHG
jgi:lipopolysaccharide/colanic/teichoic acid biosynthesis glycosyltransferase